MLSALHPFPERAQARMPGHPVQLYAVADAVPGRD